MVDRKNIINGPIDVCPKCHRPIYSLPHKCVDVKVHINPKDLTDDKIELPSVESFKDFKQLIDEYEKEHSDILDQKVARWRFLTADEQDLLKRFYNGFTKDRYINVDELPLICDLLKRYFGEEQLKD